MVEHAEIRSIITRVHVQQATQAKPVKLVSVMNNRRFRYFVLTFSEVSKFPRVKRKQNFEKFFKKVQ